MLTANASGVFNGLLYYLQRLQRQGRGLGSYCKVAESKCSNKLNNFRPLPIFFAWLVVSSMCFNVLDSISNYILYKYIYNYMTTVYIYTYIICIYKFTHDSAVMNQPQKLRGLVGGIGNFTNKFCFRWFQDIPTSTIPLKIHKQTRQIIVFPRETMVFPWF